MDTRNEQEVELRMLNEVVDEISVKVDELERRIDDAGQLPSDHNSAMQDLTQQLGTISTQGECRENDGVDEQHHVMQSTQRADRAQMASDISDELNRIDVHLEQLKLSVLQNCRKFTTEEKIQLARCISRFAAEDVNKALQIIAEDNPNLLQEAREETAQVEMDTLSESTLWKLKFFVIDTLRAQNNCSQNSGA